MFIKLHKRNTNNQLEPFLANVKKIKYITKSSNEDNITCVTFHKSWLYCIESVEQIEQMIKNERN